MHFSRKPRSERWFVRITPVLVWTLLLFSAASVFAGPWESLRAFKGKVLLASEFEMSPERLKLIVDQFDINNDYFKVGVLDANVAEQTKRAFDATNRDSLFASLPAEVQARGVGASPIEKWRSLSLSDQMEANLNLFERTIKAYLITRCLKLYHWETIAQSQMLPLKAGSRLTGVLQNFTWRRDLDSLEFATTKPISDPEEYAKANEQFLGLFELDNDSLPLEKRMYQSFHLNISFPEGPPLDFVERLEAYNVLTAFRMVDSGYAAIGHLGLMVVYQLDLLERGVLRLKDPKTGYFELRALTMPLGETILEIASLMTMSTEEFRETMGELLRETNRVDLWKHLFRESQEAPDGAERIEKMKGIVESYTEMDRPWSLQEMGCAGLRAGFKSRARVHAAPVVTQ